MKPAAPIREQSAIPTEYQRDEHRVAAHFPRWGEIELVSKRYWKCRVSRLEPATGAGISDEELCHQLIIPARWSPAASPGEVSVRRGLGLPTSWFKGQGTQAAQGVPELSYCANLVAVSSVIISWQPLDRPILDVGMGPCYRRHGTNRGGTIRKRSTARQTNIKCGNSRCLI